MNRSSVNKVVLILLVIFISAIFFSMIRSFLMAIFLAGIFSSLAHPVYSKFENWYKGRKGLASITTLILSRKEREILSSDSAKHSSGL